MASSSSNSPDYTLLVEKINKLQQDIDLLKERPSGSSPCTGAHDTPVRRHRLKIPMQCQSACRRMMRKLQEEPGFVLSFSSFGDNEEAMQRIEREVRRCFSDQNWSSGTIAEACKRIWTNMRDENTRLLSGKKEKHRAAAKSSKRLRDKLNRRRKSLISIDWSPEKKEDMSQVMRRQFMSPEKSMDGMSGTRHRIPFQWESSRLSRRKAELDQTYRDLLPETARRMLFTIIDHPVETADGPPPKGTPDWAISRRAKNT